MSNSNSNSNDILDSQGKGMNPFNGQPYSERYHETAKKWSKFPVYLRAKEIYQTIKDMQVILITAGTGSGKSRLVPMFCLKALNYTGNVIVTMPKKMNVEQAAQTGVEWFDGEQVGRYIGMQFRGAPPGSKTETTKLLFSTDGSVVQQLFNDPALSKYNYLIIDEAHERSVNIDLILLLAKKALTLNANLKLIIMSATVDPELFKQYYSSEFKFKYIDVSGVSNYPVKINYLEKPLANPETEFLSKAVEIIIDIIKRNEPGDIIAFVNSGNEANKGCDLLREAAKKQNIKEPFCIEVSSGATQQTKNYLELPEKYKMNNPGKFDRRIVWGSNVIEAGVTLSNFLIVIENGFSFQKGFNPEKMEYSLNLHRISKQSVVQRRGRVGRTQPGTCYSLYTEEEYKRFPDFTITEINNNDLTNVLLKFMIIPDVIDIKSMMDFISKMIEPPKKIAVQVAIRNLHALGAIELEKANNGNILNGHITDLGKYLLRFRKLDPPLALALLKSYAFNTEQEVAVLGVLLSEMDAAKGITTYFNPPNKFRTPEEKRRFMRGSEVRKGLKHAYGDIFVVKKIYDKFVEYKMRHNEQELRKWCYDHFFDLGELDKISRRYRETLEESRKVKAEYMQQYGNKERNSVKVYDKLENNILHPLLEGLFTNLAFNVGKVYKNCFPIVPSIADLYKDSLILQLKKQPEYMFYIVLYSFMGRTNFMVNTMVPKEVLVNLSKDKLKMVMNCIKRVNNNKPSGKNIRKANNK